MNLFGQAYQQGLETIQPDYHEMRETYRGRQEIQRHWTTSCLEQISHREPREKLDVVGMVESQCCINGEQCIDHRRYFLAGLERNDAKFFADAVRSYRGVEDSLNRVLDIAFREDDSRIRNAYAQENLRY